MTFINEFVLAFAIPASFSVAGAVWLSLKVRSARLDRPRLWTLADVVGAVVAIVLAAPVVVIFSARDPLWQFQVLAVYGVAMLLGFYTWSAGLEAEQVIETPASLQPVDERIWE